MPLMSLYIEISQLIRSANQLRIRAKQRDLQSKNSKNCEYGHFSCSVDLFLYDTIIDMKWVNIKMT